MKRVARRRMSFLEIASREPHCERSDLQVELASKLVGLSIRVQESTP